MLVFSRNSGGREDPSKHLRSRYAADFDLFGMQLAMSHELGHIINGQFRQQWNTGLKRQMARR